MKRIPTTQTLIALAFIVFAFYVFRMILLREVKATESTVISIVSSVTNITMLIVGYYFGSSQGSKDKADMLKDKTPSQNM